MATAQEVDLQEVFPDLQPIKTAPSLTTVNGWGTALYGARDRHEETETYIKTRYFTAFFLPLIALGSYRVAKAEGRGWYFIGKEPISQLAKLLNAVVLGGIICGTLLVAWSIRTSSPSYRARQGTEAAHELLAAGKVGAAAEKYSEIALLYPQHGNEALRSLQDLAKQPPEGTPPTELVGLFAAATKLATYERWTGDQQQLVTTAEELAKQAEVEDAESAIELLNAVEALVDDPTRLTETRQAILEPALQQDPQNMVLTTHLALLYEQLEQPDRCRELLEPFVDQLGKSEGARILGQLYASEGAFEAAYKLLSPYCEDRIAAMHKAELKFDKLAEDCQNEAWSDLENGRAPDQFYTRYDQVGEAEQERMVMQYVGDALQQNPQVAEAERVLREHSHVVPVALDLGIVTLRRGQAIQDAEQRRKVLEQAEKTFLSIGGMAGESDEYRLFLGQVYYWLGKEQEGLAEFDQLLEARDRAPETLLAVSHARREVGDEHGSRQLAEEAYNAAKKDEIRYHSARVRALLFKDLEDQIAWLERSDSTNVEVRASLATARANQALRKGRDDLASEQLREAIKLYESMPESTSSLNNSALAYFALYRATGDVTDFGEGVRRMERALELEPDDTILLANTAMSMLAEGIQQVLAESIDFSGLKCNGDFDLVPHLFEAADDEAEYVESLRANPRIDAAKKLLERVLVLAPKRVGPYEEVAGILRYCQDLEALRQLQQRISAADLDQENSRQQQLDYYARRDDDKWLGHLQDRVQRNRAIWKSVQDRQDKTAAIAATKYSESLMALATMESSVDAEDVLKLAMWAHQTDPSQATLGQVTLAHVLRAHQRLVHAEPEYSKLADEYGRSLGPFYLVVHQLYKGRPHRKQLLMDPDIQQAARWGAEAWSTYPGSITAWDWAFLRSAGYKRAGELKDAMLADEIRGTNDAVQLLLNPLSATAAFDFAWRAQARGEADTAQQILDACRAQGAPVPDEL